MKFGYKTFIALTLATAACFRTKAQNQDADRADNFMETIDDYQPTELEDSSTISFEEAQKLQDVAPQPVEDSDSAALEKIYQSVLEIEHDAVRFIAHFESIKMNAYWDKVAKKWTIGFGNTTHPDGRPIRSGDRIKDEAELMYYFRSYFKDRVAPAIRDYLPGWENLEKHEKIAMLDLFWNAGSGQGILFTKKEYDAEWQRLSEESKDDIGQHLLNSNKAISYDGQAFNLGDLPEWHNLSPEEQQVMRPVYQNYNIVKGNTANQSYSEKWRILNEAQRTEVSDLLQQQNNLMAKAQADAVNLSDLMRQDFASASMQQFKLKMPSLHYQAVNDSTIRYMGFLNTEDYTLGEVPPIYKLNPEQRLEVCKRLTKLNENVCFTLRNKQTYALTAEEIPMWYLLNKTEKNAVRQLFDGHTDVLYRTSSDPAKKPVLSNLGYELNTYAISKDPVAKERVATRIASFIRSRGKVVPALQKRAAIRAKVFSGEIQLNGTGDNSIDLENAAIGASYSLKLSDLGDVKLICDSINNCNFGKNFADTMQYQVTHYGRTTKSNIRSRNRTQQRRPQGRVLARSGARGR